MDQKRIDLTGRRFGRQVVISEAPSAARWRRMWNCRCDCGNIRPVYQGSLLKGVSKSCRCSLTSEAISEAITRHGHTKRSGITPEYQAWRGAHNRCHNPKVAMYPRYGGRGIKVCERWKSFENFLTDMGPRPSPRHSLDRIDLDGNYEPSNCRWATAHEQANNKSNCIILEHQGLRLTTSEWASRTGISAMTIRYRIKSGWSVEKSLTTPTGTTPKPNAVMLTYQGETLCVAEWARRIGMGESALMKRVRKGLSVEEALTRPKRTW